VEQGTGSGFIVSSDGYILTNNHVVAGADRVMVRLYDKREFTAKVVGSDPATDVAVIKIDARDLPAVSLGNSDSTRVGEWVLAIGNPLGEAFTFTVTAGIVSAKGRLLNGLQQSRYAIQDFIQTDAAINPGNSGGPLVNVRGDVIGINAAIASETGFYSGYGFAIPINLAHTVMEQLIKTGHVERAVMGVAIREVQPEDADAVGLKEISGVVVNSYTGDDSPAKRAGIQPGDVIVALATCRSSSRRSDSSGPAMRWRSPCYARAACGRPIRCGWRAPRSVTKRWRRRQVPGKARSRPRKRPSASPYSRSRPTTNRIPASGQSCRRAAASSSPTSHRTGRHSSASRRSTIPGGQT